MAALTLGKDSWGVLGTMWSLLNLSSPFALAAWIDHQAEDIGVMGWAHSLLLADLCCPLGAHAVLFSAWPSYSDFCLSELPTHAL